MEGVFKGGLRWRARTCTGQAVEMSALCEVG